MPRTRRTIALTLALLAALAGVGFATGLITVYDAPGNAGVVIGVPCHNVGLEVRGVPGLFADTCE